VTWGQQPPPLNAPPAQEVGIGVQAGAPPNTFRRVVIIGAGGLLLVYSPTAGLGNLIASIAGAPGTDTYGNAYVEGITSYEAPGVGVAAGLASGELILYSGPVSGAGPWVQQFAASVVSSQVQLNTANNPLSINSGGAPATAAGTTIDGLWTGGQRAFIPSGSTETYTSTTLATSANLAVSGLISSGIYRFNLSIVYDGAAANGQLKWSVATDGSGHAAMVYTGTTGAVVTNADAFPLTGHAANTIGVGSYLGLTIRGILFLPVSSTGAVAMQFAQNAASATATTLYNGSFLELERIG